MQQGLQANQISANVKIYVDSRKAQKGVKPPKHRPQRCKPASKAHEEKPLERGSDIGLSCGANEADMQHSSAMVWQNADTACGTTTSSKFVQPCAMYGYVSQNGKRTSISSKHQVS